MNFSSILLTGGKSKRFGPNKVKILSGRVPLVAEQTVKLGFFTREVIVSTSPENKGFLKNVMDEINGYVRALETPDYFKLPEIRVVLDDNITRTSLQGIGPVAGIYTGLKESANKMVLVMASDMPLISYRLLQFLTRTAKQEYSKDAVIIRHKKGIETLCGIYSKKCIKIIEEGILKGIYKISDILKGLEVRWIVTEELEREGIDQFNFFNINSGKDIEEYVNILKRGLCDYGTHNLHSRSGQEWKGYFFRGVGKETAKEKI